MRRDIIYHISRFLDIPDAYNFSLTNHKIASILVNLIKTYGKLRNIYNEYINISPVELKKFIAWNNYKSCINELFCCCAELGFLDDCKRLYKQYTVNIHISEDHALKWASAKGQRKIVHWLLTLDTFPKKTLKYSYIWAAENGHIDICELYIKSYNVNPRAKTDAAFRSAATRGQIAVCEWLHNNYRACIGAKKNEAFLSAVKFGHVEMVKWLYSKGVNTRFQNDVALHVASRNGHLELVELLILIGANPRANNSVAFAAAAEFGHIDVCMYLVRFGAKPLAQNNYSICVAARNGYLELCQWLYYECNADIRKARKYAAPNVKQWIDAQF